MEGQHTHKGHLAEWCSPELAAAFPEFAGFLEQVRRNCELVRGR